MRHSAHVAADRVPVRWSMDITRAPFYTHVRLTTRILNSDLHRVFRNCRVSREVSVQEPRNLQSKVQFCKWHSIIYKIQHACSPNATSNGDSSNHL